MADESVCCLLVQNSSVDFMEIRRFLAFSTHSCEVCENKFVLNGIIFRRDKVDTFDINVPYVWFLLNFRGGGKKLCLI